MTWSIYPSGTSARIRPLAPADGGLVRAVFDGLGDESRYQRFLNPKPHLSDADVRILTDVDGHDHVALVVEVASTSEPVAIGRFVREEHTTDIAAEVVDDWQGRGIGSRLLDMLIDQAGAVGATRLHAETLASNYRALCALRRRGFSPAFSRGPHVEMDLVIA